MDASDIVQETELFHKDVDRRGEVEQHCRRAVQLLEPLVAEVPSEPKYRNLLGQTFHKFGYLLMLSGKQFDAERQYEAAIRTLDNGAADFPAEPSLKR